AVPVPDPADKTKRNRILLIGDLPSPINPPSGCVFHTRCPKYREELNDEDKQRCVSEVPLLEPKAPGHWAACHFAKVRTDIVVEVTEAPPTDAAAGAEHEYARPASEGMTPGTSAGVYSSAADEPATEHHPLRGPSDLPPAPGM
ncbi:MAG: glutathione transport system ATP-binding protein, partial [Pseudonocardiales bacterium]|nr:glutathione transport system ATP-binding protein [Pseudonocardiales bacterium]